MSILVLGGTGKTGRRVTARLRALGHAVRAASRSTGFDWDKPGTWDATLDGAESIYLVTHPTRFDPTEQVKDLLSRTAGRVVFLSARDLHSPAEPVVREHAGGWTVLRPTWFNQNFSEDFFNDGVVAGHLALPTGEGREPFVDADDIADVAVAALTDPRHAGETYELSGPAALSFRDAVAHIAQASGRPITYEPVPAEVYRDSLVSYGLDAEYAGELVALLTGIAEGKGEYLSDGVHRALGRPPRSFTDFAAATWGRSD